ncbi:VWA domain-containing protein [Nocardia sp. R6R-6]|uniref:VWA domain-containing protein n=1 Tax=Nocardia sp. R6R-6 TaxID=3459303 RepID=UPI00403DD4A0
MVAVALLAAIVVGWFQLRDRAADQDSAAAAECVEGPATLHVIADPSIAAQVRLVADSYNATRPKIRDHCAEVAVAAQPSSAIVAAFTSGKPWDPALGPQPALWIADSTRSIESMRVPGLIEGTPVPVAASPVVLAVPEELRSALEQAETSWADLPRLQQGSLSELGLSGWGGLRMAVPPGDATLAAATAVGSAVSGTDPLSADAARSGQVVAAVSGLAVDAPQASDTTAALTAIAARNAPVHAVAVTEQQVKAQPGLAVFRPAGSAPTADYPAALMSGAWVDKTQNLIAGRFTDYLRKPEQAQAFAAAGFASAPQAPNVAPARGALDKVRTTLANPVLGVRSTVLVDVSASMGTTEGAATRLANVIAALNSTMTVMPPEFGLGVWAFGKNLDRTSPYEVAAATATLTDDQRTKIATALGTLRPSESRSDGAYPSLIAAYKSAVSGYAPSRTNSVLLITDGPDDDSTVTGPQLAAGITAAVDPTRPVRIDVIVLGGNGTQTLQALARETGGSYTRLTTSNDLGFGSAVVKALTTP